jgi:hypothetical protein
MFFKVLAAIVTADAVDRRMREQQRRKWAAERARRQASAPTPPAPRGWGAPVMQDRSSASPERPA